VSLRLKSLAFLIENSPNKNSFQLADNKQKRPVLIEDFGPTRFRVFSSRPAHQIAPAVVLQPPIVAFLTETGAQTEIDVTRSKQRVRSFLTETRIDHLRPVALPAQTRKVSICEGRSAARVVSPNTDPEPRSTCLNVLQLHITNCKLNGLQLFPSAGVHTNRHIEGSTARADNMCVPYLEASFAVE
jgi:hypothetical protein